jgi:hypothetical protein
MHEDRAIFAGSLRPATAVLVVSLLAGSLVGCIPGKILGDVLSGLLSDVNTVIQNSIASGEAAAISTALVVQQAIENARSAFAADLNQAIDKVSEDVRNVMSRLETDVRELEGRVHKLLRHATQDAQQLINSMPLTNKNPQITSYTPRYVSSLRKDDTITVTLRGNWPLAMETSKTPTIVAAGRTIEPVALLTQEMAFNIPAAAFPSPKQDEFLGTSLEVTIPYESGVIFKTLKPGVFRLLLVTLPTTPVRSLKLTNTVTKKERITQLRRSPSAGSGASTVYGVESYSTCKEGVLDPVQIRPSSGGWKLDTETFQIVKTVERNAANVDVRIEATEDLAQVTARTKPACVDFVLRVSTGSGAVSFYVLYSQYRDVDSTSNSTTELPLNWGDQINIPVTPNGWKVEAVMFDGRSMEFTDTGTDLSEPPYLQVVNQGKTIQISAPASNGLGL